MSDFFNTGSATVAKSVPPELKLLIRTIMRTFYGFELYLCMDVLLVYPCIKEEDLAEILRLEAKLVHQHLVNLKKEKFVNERPIMETSGDGKQKSHSYYFINYKMMVNVVKYKLDKIRIQIESEEKHSTTRALFKCTQCKKSFSDLETKDIFFTMRCDHCGGDVEEDASSLPSRASRNLLPKMNMQLKVVFELLEKLEHVRLADNILCPEPMDMSTVLNEIGTSNASSQAAGNRATKSDKLTGQSGGAKYDGMSGIKWSDPTSRKDLLSQTKVSINFDTGESGQSANGRPLKELPSIILANQTTDDTINNMDTGRASINRDSLLLNNIKKAANDTLYNTNGMHLASTGSVVKTLALHQPLADSTNTSGHGRSSKTPSVMTGGDLEALILQKLMIHEKAASGEQPKEHEPMSRTNSFASIGIKRGFDFLKTNRSESNLLDDNLGDPLGLKRRRLENGDVPPFGKEDYMNCDESKPARMTAARHNFHHYGNQKSFSDGSDREMDEDIDRETPTSCLMEEDDDQASSDTISSSGIQVDNDSMPVVFVQAKPMRLDRVTAKFTDMMTDKEKDYYINVCRHLYTELYEN